MSQFLCHNLVMNDQVHPWKPGQIIYCSSGYQLDEIKFYLVEKMTPSGKTLTLRRLPTLCVFDDCDAQGVPIGQGYCTPDTENHSYRSFSRRVLPYSAHYTLRLTYSDFVFSNSKHLYEGEPIRGGWYASRALD